MLKPKAIITGSSGMLGRALCDVLSRYYQVFGMDLENRNKLKNFRVCDITKFEQIKKSILTILPDIIIHTAAYTDVDGCEKNKGKAEAVNTQGAINIAKVSKDIGAAIFFISTDYVFDGKKKKPYLESDISSPLSIYGKSKLAAEEFIRHNLSEYFIIRTSWLYGAGGKNFVDTIINESRKESILKVVNDQFGAPTFVADLARAIENLIKKTHKNHEKYSGIYHITNSGRCSWYEFAREIVKIKKLRNEVIPIESKELRRLAKRPANSLLNNTKYNQLTSKPMRHWKNALRAFLQSEDLTCKM